jgi:hypothetical protein
MTVRTQSSRVVLLSTLTLLVVLSGCDLLQTRSPENPSQAGSTFVPPTSADIVVTNLQASIREKNKQNYLRCLVDTTISNRTFEFTPTVEARANNPGVFEGWTIASEDQYFKNLSESRSDGLSSLDLSNTTTNALAGDEVLFSGKYRLIFQHQNSSVAQEARGNLQFYISRDQQGTWSIYRWIDLRDTSDVTWSDIKASFIR